MTDIQRPDRMAPHSVEAEEAVLGSILIDQDARFDVMPFLHTDDFFIVRNGWVYEAIGRLHARAEMIDYVTVCEELRTQERLEDIGGPAYITYLVNHTPSSIYAEAYGRVIERAALRRRLLAAASELAQLAHEEAADIHEVLNRVEATVFAVTDRHHTQDVQPIGAVIGDVWDYAERAQRGELGGLITGFTDLDRILGGLECTDLIIGAGRPGMGKTSLAMTIAYEGAKAGRLKPLMFSMEMSKQQLVRRLTAMETGIPSNKFKDGTLTDAEWSTFADGITRIEKLPIYIDDTPNLSILTLSGKARRAVAKWGINCILVDYLQLMEGMGGENRTQEVSKISRGLKLIAKSLKVPVLALSQLSRAVDTRQDKRPHLSDLRDSGTIEQDADVVMFIYRDEEYNEATTRPNQADIIVAKHRNGPTGTASLFFKKELTQFANLRTKDLNFAPVNGNDGDGVYRGGN